VLFLDKHPGLRFGETQDVENCPKGMRPMPMHPPTLLRTTICPSAAHFRAWRTGARHPEEVSHLAASQEAQKSEGEKGENSSLSLYFHSGFIGRPVYPRNSVWRMYRGCKTTRAVQYGRVILVLFLVGCLLWFPARIAIFRFGGTEVSHLNGETCQETVNAFRAVLPSSWPDEERAADESMEHYLARVQKEFTADEVFSALTGLKMSKSYELDFVMDTSYDCEPVLYARRANQPAYTQFSDLLEQRGGHGFLPYIFDTDIRDQYLNFVQTDGTSESYFELVVLHVMGTHFWQRGHSNYHDETIVCHTSGLPMPKSGQLSDMELAIEFVVPAPIFEKAQYLNLDPVVVKRHNQVDVSVVVFSRWKGFSRVVYSVSEESPHRIRVTDEDLLLPYDCGVRF
jgi:hypothetical protein